MFVWLRENWSNSHDKDQLRWHAIRMIQKGIKWNMWCRVHSPRAVMFCCQTFVVDYLNAFILNELIQSEQTFWLSTVLFELHQTEAMVFGPLTLCLLEPSSPQIPLAGMNQTPILSYFPKTIMTSLPFQLLSKRANHKPLKSSDTPSLSFLSSPSVLLSLLTQCPSLHLLSFLDGCRPSRRAVPMLLQGLTQPLQLPRKALIRKMILIIEAWFTGISERKRVREVEGKEETGTEKDRGRQISITRNLPRWDG